MAGLEAGTTHIPPSSSSGAAATTSSSSSSSASGDGGEGGKGKRPKLPSFWIPTLTPSAKPTEIKKPVSLYYITSLIFSPSLLSFSPLLSHTPHPIFLCLILFRTWKPTVLWVESHWEWRYMYIYIHMKTHTTWQTPQSTHVRLHENSHMWTICICCVPVCTL